VTPEDRSREFAPGEWHVDEEPIRVLLLVPEASADEDPVLAWLEETAPENWPVLPAEESRRDNALAVLFWGGVIAFYTVIVVLIAGWLS
jgi:hypothetical protein